MSRSHLALFATVYPGVEAYLPAWHDSIRSQSDQGFDLWIAVDALSAESIRTACGSAPAATWVSGEPGDSPAQIRQRALAAIVREYPAVVLVDSDDLLESTRIAAARNYLKENDAAACAMRLVDEGGRDLDLLMDLPADTALDDLLPRHNLFGLSNTAYRSDLLAHCLSIPNRCALVDWFLITRAWALGARLAFDQTCRMAYRRHAGNTAPLLPPFTSAQIASATALVQSHYELTLQHLGPVSPARRSRLQSEQERVRAFAGEMAAQPQQLDAYVRALNQLPPTLLWWSCVAHPQLSDLWKS